MDNQHTAVTTNVKVLVAPVTITGSSAAAPFTTPSWWPLPDKGLSAPGHISFHFHNSPMRLTA